MIVIVYADDDKYGHCSEEERSVMTNLISAFDKLGEYAKISRILPSGLISPRPSEAESIVYISINETLLPKTDIHPVFSICPLRFSSGEGIDYRFLTQVPYLFSMETCQGKPFGAEFHFGDVLSVANIIIEVKSNYAERN